MTNKESVTIYLIRHGEAKAAWDEDPNPGLSKKGEQQSKCLINEISSDLPSGFEVISSPLMRAQETALPLKEELGFKLGINNTFAEIPSPGISLSERRDWLRGVFSKEVKELEEPQLKWRNSIIQSIKLIQNDTIIFTHFMVINCVVGWISNSRKFVSFHPDNCSITKIKRINGNFEILNLGKNIPTTVQ